jgi:hypothetical protein
MQINKIKEVRSNKVNTSTNLTQGSRRQDRGTGNQVANWAAQARSTLDLPASGEPLRAGVSESDVSLSPVAERETID